MNCSVLSEAERNALLGEVSGKGLKNIDAAARETVYGDLSLNEFEKRVDSLAAYGLKEEGAYLAVLDKALGYLGDEYKNRGLNEEIFYYVSADVRRKANEYAAVYHDVGLMKGAATWLYDYFKFNRVAYENLQFDVNSIAINDYDGAINVKTGDKIPYVHIPSGADLTPCSVLKTFAKFYCDYPEFIKSGGVMPIACCSYLLYPEYYPLYKANGNLQKFVDLFNVYDIEKREHFEDGWRVFNKVATEYSADLPETTSLQRSFKEYMKAGKPHGVGWGMLIFNGSKVIKEKI